MKKLFYVAFVLWTFNSCQHKEVQKEKMTPSYFVNEEGTEVSFANSENVSFFQTENINNQSIQADFSTVGIVAATVHKSKTGASENIILFENPDLTSSYTEFVQHQINIRQIKNINIRQKKIEWERTQDLLNHGSATGQELLNVEAELSIEKTNLANEQTALMEHEAKLKSAGFAIELLKKVKAETAFIIGDVPENQIGNLKEGSTCTIVFTAFPNEKFTGKLSAIADMVDNATRMIKVRIEVDNPQNKLKSGMFANITFLLEGNNFITIPENAMITVQGKHYVFVKKSDKVFERREIQTGQQIGEYITVFEGLKNGDEVVTKGVMQLKGLSFGY